MAGTWETQDKVLPGAYINIRTNEPLSITPGDRGIAVVLQEMSVGEDGQIYTITATEQAYPEKATAEDKKLVAEALKKAKTVLVYKLPETHDADAVNAALEKLKTVQFNTLCYPYDTEPEAASSNKTVITEWIKSMREEEGVKCQAVLANHEADSEGIINVVQGVILTDGTRVAGATAGAGITTSNTGMKYMGAVDVSPRMTKTEMETAVRAGKLIFKVDSAQNVTIVSDINSLTTTMPEKGKFFTKNRVIRTLDNLANDISLIFESNYVGQANNTEDGRALLRAGLVDYLTVLQNMAAIQNFETDDVTVVAGTDSDAVVVDVFVQPVDSVEKIYITVNLS